ncbi:MAG: DUF2924 domain-containing protein [Phycisphaeraceae bacterium]|nr:DUF2924 domain-containing protein [Phycisphaeraceae bacterium]MCW5769975.1 DUF2924 domain-containing protein [Phycisphaeraceae bacterium]
MSRTRTRKAPRTSASRPLVDLARLDSHGHAELLGLWRAYGGEGKPPQRRFMIREVAFRAQAHVYGDFDPVTRRLLKVAMRDAFVDRPASSASPDPDARTRRPTAPTVSAALPSGSRLVRQWRGRTYEVTVVENGKAYVYNGTTYRSLSRVASVITGSTWSGPKFFGISSRATRKGENA